MDLFSPKVIAWAAGPTLHRGLVLNAVPLAVRQRRPHGTSIQSDQGTECGSNAWRRLCRTNRLEPSMSRKGNRWDNAVAESFFSGLKKERDKKHTYKTRELAIAAESDYIESVYNPVRRHGHLAGTSPDRFESAHGPRRRGVH
jgi:putative transposase